MALAGTIAAVILLALLVVVRLLYLGPGIAPFAKRFGSRTTVVLCSIAAAGGLVLIALSRR